MATVMKLLLGHNSVPCRQSVDAKKNSPSETDSDEEDRVQLTSLRTSLDGQLSGFLEWENPKKRCKLRLEIWTSRSDPGVLGQ